MRYFRPLIIMYIKYIPVLWAKMPINFQIITSLLTWPNQLPLAYYSELIAPNSN